MANKALTIKGASDEELEALRRRLQNENEVARLIADLRCRSNASNSYATNPYEGISTEVPIDDLYHSEAADKVLAHYGVKGMKWGIRKATLSAKTKSGDTISLSSHPSSKMAKFLAKHSKKVAAEQDKTALFDIKDPNGKTVGDLTLYKESKDSINVVWVTTNSGVRGKGYGTAVMKSAINIAKETGAKKVTLEVPGKSPDAKHIYEKLGFKEMPTPDSDPNDYWGGLTNMELDLGKFKHSDSGDGLCEISSDVAKKYLSSLINEIDKLSTDETYLAHYGILGMKWGKRKAKTAANPSEDHKRAQSLKGKKISEMSTSELRDLTQRLQLERQYKDLKKSEISEGQKLVTGILKDIGRDMLKEAIRSGVKAGSKASNKALKNKLNK